MRRTVVVALVFCALGCADGPAAQPETSPKSGKADDPGFSVTGGSPETALPTDGLLAPPRWPDRTLSPDNTAIPNPAPSANDGPGTPGGEGVGYGDRADETCGYGTIYGLVCSPTDQTFVNGATVFLDATDCAGLPVHIETLTDSEGFYILPHVPSGYWEIHVDTGTYQNDYTVLVKNGKITDVTGMGYKQCFQVTQECDTGQILGSICQGDEVITDLTGKAYVNTTDCEGEPVYVEASTDADGYYLLTGIPAGPVWVFVELLNQSLQFQVDVAAGQTVELTPIDDPEICFPPDGCEVGTLTGKVCTPTGDAWIEAGQISITATDCNGAPMNFTATTDAEGAFWLDNLPVGSHWLNVNYIGTGYQVPVTVVANNVTDVGVIGAVSCNPLEVCGYGSIEGYVCAPSGVSVSNAIVTVEAIDCNGQTVILTAVGDAEGNYSIDGVPAGTVTVHVEKGKFDKTYTLNVEPNETTTVADEIDDLCFPDDQVKIAVVTGNWDSIEQILDALGLSYDLYDGVFNTGQTISLLTNLDAMLAYDIIFFNCGAMHYDIITASAAIAPNLSAFVAAGGSIYASDWAFVYAEFPWPSAIDFYGNDSSWSGPKVGVSGSMTGNVIDPGLQAYLGKSSVSIVFNLDIWVVVSSAAQGTIVHVTGNGGQPLLVSHRPSGGPGTVQFTTFHNEPQITGDMMKILYYLVFEL